MKLNSSEDFSHGDQYSKIKQIHGNLVDFSSSINPVIASGWEIDTSESLRHYPSIEDEAEKRIGEALGCPSSQVVIFAGMTPLIHVLFDMRKTKNILLLEPLFSEYRNASHIRGCNITRLPLKVIAKHPEMISNYNFDMACINNPVNPTGEYLSRDLMIKIAEITHAKGAMLFIDEAYIDFLPSDRKYNTVDFVKNYPGVMLGRTFTKITGVPGIRVGFAIASISVASRIRDLRPPWTVPDNVFDLLPAMLSARKDADIIEQLAFLKRRLIQCGFSLIGDSVTNMISFEIDERLDSEQFYNKLIGKGFLIRPLRNFYTFNRNSFRISVRCAQENEDLMNAMEEIINE